MSKLKKTMALFLLPVLVSVAEAQVIHDPNDPLYKDLDWWAVRGYLTQALPMVRPYPAQLLDELLEEAAGRAAEAGDEAAALRARRYRDAIAPGSRALHAGARAGAAGLDGDADPLLALFAEGTPRLRDWLAGSFAFAGYGSTKSPAFVHQTPGIYGPQADLIPDDSGVGAVELLPHWTSALTVGTGDFYFQAGLIRSSLGPLYDNGVIVGPQASRAGHFSLVYRRPKWTFEALWLELVAADTTGQGRYPNKHMVTHIYSFRPIQALEVSFFESVVWGGRFEPLYLLPFSWLMASQAMADFGDNSLMGFLVRWSFIRNAQFLTQVYVDDIHFNDIMRFQFDTKYKFAAELGLVWAPERGPLRSLAGDYTIVFPYMYTHMYDLDPATYGTRYPSQTGYGGPHPNYQDYSHAGKNLGPDLEPNSDRISLRSTWNTLPSLDISLSAYLIRHGNASQNRIDQDMMDGAYHDGSIFDDGNDDKPDYDNNYRSVRFLTQSVLETRLAGGIELSWRLPLRFGDVTLQAGYVAEYGWNRGLVRGNDGLVNYWSLGGTYRY
ncbi:MAG: hypothetical protein LBG84_09245 [Treponema sp.]|jgi:hypothetical protein|nr:hypothetical protein [Treponema sp.]